MILCDRSKQLKQRVKLHKLNSRKQIGFLLRQQFEKIFHRIVGAVVAVSKRQTSQITITGYQCIINTPGVNANGIGLNIELRNTISQTDFQLFKQTDNIPVKVAMNLCHLVFKPVNLNQLKLIVFKGSEHCPSAGCANIEG